MTIDFIADGPDGAPATVLLAHGAGAPMDSPAMNAIALALAGVNLRVARFEFGYMAARRTGARKPLSGFSAADHLATMADATARWIARVTA